MALIPFVARDVASRCLYLRAFQRFYDPLTAIPAFARVKMRYENAILRMVEPDEDGTLAACRELVSNILVWR